MVEATGGPLPSGKADTGAISNNPVPFPKFQNSAQLKRGTFQAFQKVRLISLSNAKERDA